uniref:desmoglein-2-like n=1 Tax=Epinephelus lanceolatus TaxID=310571 RepID=UPI00144891F1|nr:desmoglein-2-like [Epinephelus lanceolatus]
MAAGVEAELWLGSGLEPVLYAGGGALAAGFDTASGEYCGLLGGPDVANADGGNATKLRGGGESKSGSPEYLWGCLGDNAASVPQLRRQKRDWVVPTKKLFENYVYPPDQYVARIRSDWDSERNLHYTLLGPGASQEPVNLFVVDDVSGLVYIRGTLDREERETYILTGVATFSNGSTAENRIDLRFDVEDDNDNPPVFVPVPPATVQESSPAGTLVGRITATDADKANCSHSKIAYSLVKQEPSDGRKVFYIDRKTGSIYVKENTIDREIHSSYTLTVEGTDMDGAPGGNTGTGTIHVKVVDINDNVPKLEKDEYAGSIVENTAQVEVMRFKVLDDDEEKSDNWLAVFDIVTGNEDGIFSIETDPKTNEGVLMLEKPVDFEENPDIKLGVVVYNVAPAIGDGDDDGDGQGGGGGGGAGTGAGAGSTVTNQSNKKRPIKGKLYPVNIAVVNEPEGVAFKPRVKPVSVSENPEENPLMEVIGVFAATDSDTGKPAENVRYAKGYDPDNWLLIDPETAEIRLQKFPDRESPFLVNGTYYAEILSLNEDRRFGIATGTIALKVGDVNDDCPTLTNHVEYICSDTEVINVTAVDEDGHPNSDPFTFLLVEEESRGDWRVEPLNGTSASLRALKPLWAGHYQVAFIIQDQQGLACPDPQYLDLHVCSCEKGETCKPAGIDGQTATHKESSSTFGGLGVGALILGLLMLLAVGVLLITCSCGGESGSFSDFPFDTTEHLIVYHTEARDENKEVALLSSPVQTKSAAVAKLSASNGASNTKANTTATLGNLEMGSANKTYTSRYGADSRNWESFGESRETQTEFFSMEEELLRFGSMDDITLSDVFLHQYYSQKARCAAKNQAARDCVLEYEYEGQGSPAGSVSSCSLPDSEKDQHFLDDLGLKFKKLADICSPPRPPTPLSFVTQQVDKVDHIAVPLLESKPPSIQGKIQEQTQNVSSISKSSTGVMGLSRKSSSSMHGINTTSVTGFNRSASGSMHGQFSHCTSSMPHLPHIGPVTTAMMPSVAQMLVLQQQPVYYTTTPMMQPMHYIVQPQLQNTVLLADGPVSNLQIHGGNTAGTFSLGRRRGNRVMEDNQGVKTWTFSHGPGVVMGVRKSGRRIKSESGEAAETCHSSTGMQTGRCISLGAVEFPA